MQKGIIRQRKVKRQKIVVLLFLSSAQQAGKANVSIAVSPCAVQHMKHMKTWYSS